MISIPNSTVWGRIIVNRTPQGGVRKLSEVLTVNINEDLAKAKRVVSVLLREEGIVFSTSEHNVSLTPTSNNGNGAYELASQQPVKLSQKDMGADFNPA